MSSVTPSNIPDGNAVSLLLERERLRIFGIPSKSVPESPVNSLSARLSVNNKESPSKTLLGKVAMLFPSKDRLVSAVKPLKIPTGSVVNLLLLNVSVCNESIPAKSSTLKDVMSISPKSRRVIIAISVSVTALGSFRSNAFRIASATSGVRLKIAVWANV